MRTRTRFHQAVMFAAAVPILAQSVLSLSAIAVAAEDESVEIRHAWYDVWGMFGALIDEDSPCAQDLKLPKGGFLVTGVSNGSTAHKIGLRRGDLIVRMGQPAETPGRPREIEIYRDNQTRTEFLTEEKVETSAIEIVEDFAPRSEPISILVDPQGQGQCQTITGALCFVAPGDTVVLRGGVYRESLTLPQGVTLRAAEQSAPIIVADTPVRAFGRVRALVLEGITLAATKTGVVILDSSQVTLNRCTIRSDEGDAAHVIRSTHVSFQACVISNSKIGIHWLQSPQGKVVNSFLDANETAIRVENSELEANGNTINGGNKDSDWAFIIRDSQIAVQENAVRNCVNVMDARSARGKVIKNLFAQNETGIYVGSGEMDIRSNMLVGQGAYGILVQPRPKTDKQASTDEPAPPKVTISGNTISATEGSAIALQNCQADVAYNLLEANVDGISVRGGSAQIANNTIVLHSNRGIEIFEGTKASVFNNIVAFNSGGLVVDTTATWEGNTNNVFANFLSRSFPLIDGNYIRIDRLPLSNGEKLAVTVSPADELKSETDWQVDPGFVRTGRDHRVRSDSSLATRTGKGGLKLGALPIVELPAPSSDTSIAQHLEFRDTAPKSVGPTPVRPCRPWTAAERDAITAAFEDAGKQAPGVLARVTAYRPLRLYRGTDPPAKNFLAVAERMTNGMLIYDLAFDASQGYKSIVTTFIHECVHLGDVAQRLESSAEWVGLMTDRLASVRREVALGGGLYFERQLGLDESVQEQQRFREIASRYGLPRLYSAVNLAEALATCAAPEIDDYAAPAEIRRFLDQHLFSLPYQPNESWRQFHEALELCSQEEFDPAEQMLTALLEADPEFRQIHLYRGYVRKDKQTRQTLQRGKPDWDSPIADFHAAYEAFSKISYSQLPLVALDEQARCHVGKNDFERAIALQTQAIAIHHQPHIGYFARSATWNSGGRLDEAINDATAAIERAPENAAYCTWRGDLWIRKRAFDKAAADYSRVISLQPADKNAYRKHAELAQALGDHRKAISDFEFLLSKSSVDPSTRLSRGRSYMALGEYQAAADDFAAGLKPFPRPVPDLLRLRLEALVGVGQSESAIREIEGIVAKSPTVPAWRVLRGDVWRWTGQFQKALTEYDEIIQANPDFADGYRARAWFRATCPDPTFRDAKQAVADATKAIELSGDKAWLPCLTRASAHAADGQFQDAVIWATKAADAAPLPEFNKAQTLLELFKSGKAYLEPAVLSSSVTS